LQVEGAVPGAEFEYAVHFLMASLCFEALTTKSEAAPPVILHSQVYCLLQLQTKILTNIIKAINSRFMFLILKPERFFSPIKIIILPF